MNIKINENKRNLDKNFHPQQSTSTLMGTEINNRFEFIIFF